MVFGLSDFHSGNAISELEGETVYFCNQTIIGYPLILHVSVTEEQQHICMPLRAIIDHPFWQDVSV